MNNRKAQTAERQARLAALQAEQRKKERRRTAIIAAVVGAVVLALVGVTLAVVLQQSRRNAEIDDAAQGDIEGVETFEVASVTNHVPGDVEYPQNPPVGGDHNGVWQNCGVYSEPIQEENAVHSLEHGAVWLTYDAALPTDQVELLRAQAASNNYVLVSPVEDLPSPVVASAWGIQLQLEDASDDRLATFVRKYVRGEQTPEPGASCSGGTGTPE